MSGLAPIRGRLAAALPRTPAWPLLPCALALIGYVAALGALMLVLIADNLREQARSFDDRLTVEIPASASEARIEMALALLRQTTGIRSVRRLETAEISRLLEPSLGAAAATDTLPVPRLVDVQIDLDTVIDLADLRGKLSSIAPGAQVEDHRLRLGRSRTAVFGAEVLIALALAGLALLGGWLAMLATGARVASHRATFDLLHLIGAAGSDVVAPLQKEALLLGLVGGAIGAVAALLTWGALGSAIWPARPAVAALGDWRLWSNAAAVSAALGVVAAAGARLALSRQLTHMP